MTDMMVHSGTIYALLGASGCGKTTLLSCIVGLKKLDRGSIVVYGHRPNSAESGIPGKTIGYQPQELALYEQFTVREILYYYAKIYSMKKSETRERIKFLSNFLDLPPCSKRISEASGGEQRRISLAVSMIHKPKLLVLDEPTVGLDPLIRVNIWNYVKTLVKTEQISLVMSTHYIEEARNADTVGIMRNGRILVEKCPQALLKEYQTDLMETIVLKLCIKDEAEMQNANIVIAPNKSLYHSKKFSVQRNKEKNEAVMDLKYKSRSPDDYTLQFPKKSHSKRKSFFKEIIENVLTAFNKIHALTFRNFTILFRSWLFVICFLVLPAMQVALFNIVVGKQPKNIGIGVVNHEFEGADFLEMCRNRSNDCFEYGLSCTFFNQFSQSGVTWEIHFTEEEALKSVQRGNTWGFVTIPENFTESMKYRSIERHFATNETLDGIKISGRFDMTNYQTNAFLTEKFYTRYLNFIKSVADSCEEDSRNLEIPMRFNAIYGSEESGYSEFIQPNVVLIILFFLSTAVAAPIVVDKKQGTLDRSLISGVTYFQIFISYLISHGFLILIQIILGMIVLIGVFDCKVEGSISIFFSLCFLMGICGLSFGFLFGTLCDHEKECIMCILALFQPCVSSSGSMWPLISSWAVQLIIKILNPLTVPCESVRSVVNRGWEATHSEVFPGFVVILGWTLFCLISGAIIHRVRKTKQ